jgi:hypothetical protein
MNFDENRLGQQFGKVVNSEDFDKTQELRCPRCKGLLLKISFDKNGYLLQLAVLCTHCLIDGHHIVAQAAMVKEPIPE